MPQARKLPKEVADVASKKVVTNRDLQILGFRSMFLQASFNFQRMQSGGFTWAMLPLLKKIYGDDKAALSAAMKDNMEFINTHPNLVGFMMGLMISMEENGESRDLIKGIKVALFGPLAGIGDAIFWFTILPIMTGICASFAANGNILGPVLFIAVYLIIYLLRNVFTVAGYNLGVSAVAQLKENTEYLANAATVLGITVIGALISAYVGIELLPVIEVGDFTVNLQADFFDMIIPNFLPFCYVMLMFYFIRKKQVNPVILILATIAVVLVCSFFGIL